MEYEDRNPPSLVAVQVCLNFCIINKVQYLWSCLGDSIFVRKTLVCFWYYTHASERDVGRYKCRRNESLLTSILNDSLSSKFTLLITKYIYLSYCWPCETVLALCSPRLQQTTWKWLSVTESAQWCCHCHCVCMTSGFTYMVWDTMEHSFWVWCVHSHVPCLLHTT